MSRAASSSQVPTTASENAGCSAFLEFTVDKKEKARDNLR